MKIFWMVCIVIDCLLCAYMAFVQEWKYAGFMAVTAVLASAMLELVKSKQRA